MVREYAFQRKITDEQAKEIIEDAKKLDGLQDMIVTDDHKAIQVKANNEDYERLMERILNICSRITGGQCISCTRFVHNENE